MSTDNEFVYEIPREGVWAKGLLEFPEMVVLQGSTLSPTVEPTMPPHHVATRHYLELMKIIDFIDGKWRFTRDHRFGSTSEAACIVAGGSRDGFKTWRNGVGQCLRDLGYSRSRRS